MWCQGIECESTDDSIQYALSDSFANKVLQAFIVKLNVEFEQNGSKRWRNFEYEVTNLVDSLKVRKKISKLTKVELNIFVMRDFAD